MHDVAFSCDNNGVPFLKVAVGSLLKHYRGAEPLRVNVFEGYGGHSPESKAALAAIVDAASSQRTVDSASSPRQKDPSPASTPTSTSALPIPSASSTLLHGHSTPASTPPPPFFTLRYVNVEETLKPYEDAILHRDNSRWNVFTWTPVFTPVLLPDATGNVIHFDIDMLFNADVSELFALDLNTPQPPQPSQPSQPSLIACTYEYDKYGDNAGRVVWEKGILPPSVERYFNTGVLVFNVEACRAERTWEKIVDWYRTNYAIADRIEQDAWNALYWDRMRPLDVAWNFHDRAMKNYAKWDLSAKYWLGNPPAECLRAALAPKLLHFWGPKKPWKVSHRPYRKLYHAAMRAVGLTPPREPFLAPWYDFANARILRRLRRRLGAVPLRR